MPSRLFLLFVGFVFCQQVQAQAYEAGLLVRSNGDTLRGEIENNFWLEPPTFIRFRTTPAAPSQLFNPRQLRAVRFNGGRYFRKEALPIDHAAETRTSLLSITNRSDVRLDTVLADVLVDGPASLLRVKQPGSLHYFARRPGKPVLSMYERKYLRRTSTGATIAADANNYSGHLTVYFGDCTPAARLAQSASFTPAALAAVVQAYNTACDPGHRLAPSWLVEATPRRRMALQGGVLAGVRYQRLASSAGVLAGKCADCRVHPFAGLYADLLLPNRTAALYGELSISSFSNRIGEYSQVNTTVTSVAVDYRGGLATSRLGLRFLFPRPRERQVLLTVGYELNVEINPRITAVYGPVGPVSKDLLRYGQPTLLPNVGLGWRSNRFTLSLDGQMYSADADASSGFWSNLFGSNFALRTAVGYRLGPNPDVLKPTPTAQ